MLKHASQHDDLIQNLREMSEHLAKDTQDAVARTASAMAHSAAELVEQAREQAEPVIKGAAKEVREHPVTTAALLAAAVGLMGYALTRHQRHT